MARPTRFEHNRYVGDKRTQVVYDLDLAESDPVVAAAVDELLASECFTAFGPDTLAEARNRGYRPHRSIRLHEPNPTVETEESRRATRRSRLDEANPTVEMANPTVEMA